MVQEKRYEDEKAQTNSTHFEPSELEKQVQSVQAQSHLLPTDAPLQNCDITTPSNFDYCVA